MLSWKGPEKAENYRRKYKFFFISDEMRKIRYLDILGLQIKCPLHKFECILIVFGFYMNLKKDIHGKVMEISKSVYSSAT